MIWTNDRVEELRALWSGNSASEIAAMMKISRNAVLGKAHRLGLDSKLKPATQKRSARLMPAQRSVTIVSKISRMPIATKRIDPVAEMSKTALRAMLQQAVINTGGRVA